MKCRISIKLRNKIKFHFTEYVYQRQNQDFYRPFFIHSGNRDGVRVHMAKVTEILVAKIEISRTATGLARPFI